MRATVSSAVNILKIPSEICREMLLHARAGAPLEICGILAGRGNTVERIYKGSNIEASEVSYELDPREYLRIEKEFRSEGMRMLAIYHSHPIGHARPSHKDITLAVWDAVYIIIGLADRDNPDVKGFRINGDEAREIKLRVI
ncbi:MAG: M67 family metallopeptidase [Nitrospiraceae bacterium]|nr:M67 family metallopeptidase [Nitrospiraceae bacterium]